MLWLFGISRCCCGSQKPDLFVCGGYGGVGSPFGELRDHDGYRSSADVWVSPPSADLPLPARQAQGAASLAGVGYCVGGQARTGELRDTDAYTRATDAWQSRADLPTPSRIFIAAVGAAGKVFAFGGFHQAGGPNGYLDYTQHDAFDPGSNTWSAKTDLPNPSRRSGASADVGGNVYAWAGFDGNTTQFGGAAIRDNDEYNPPGNSWAARQDLPLPARYKIQGGGSSNGKGYCVGGAQSELSGQHNGLDDIDEYNPATDTWTSRTGSGLRRAMNAVTSSADGNVHSFGGSHQTTFWSTSHLCYHPATDSWLPKASLPNPPRTDAGAFSL